jgi:hypothetical protein
MEAFPKFRSEKQQGASCDKHDHFRPAESSEDHQDKSSAVLDSPRAGVRYTPDPKERMFRARYRNGSD